MHRVKKFSFEDKEIRLLPLKFGGGSMNTYTVLVGKNGVGKSRLLCEITKDCIDHAYYSPIRAPGLSGKPPKVIAASTSPFDKFPLTPRRVNPASTNYRYLGMRSDSLYVATSAVALISSAAKGLLENAGSKKSGQNLVNVFKTLNFSTTVDLIFKPSYLGFKSARVARDFEGRWLHSEEDKTIQRRREYVLERTGVALEDKYLNQLAQVTEEKFESLVKSMKVLNEITEEKKAIHLRLDFAARNENGDDSSAGAGFTTADAFLVLLESGFIRLMDMFLKKENYGRMSLKKASSGEQCLLVLMLGIAGHIENNSIILIDEPEISLHPKWQEDFMTLLIDAFDSYQGCQFIVATHSPQVIAKLHGPNCYIASLSKNKFYSADAFKERSADFQLAELFEAPGLMNEYISRLAFSLLARIKSSQAVTVENRVELRKLRALISNADKNDPLIELVESVEVLCDYYDKNQ